MVHKACFLLLGAALGANACIGPVANAATVNLVAGFEKFVPTIYTDATGHPTVGYGHLCASSRCTDVKYPIPLSEANGKKLLSQDLAVAQNCITTHTTDAVRLNANEYGALVSWAFNVGCGAARTSTLIKRLNAGQNPKAVAESELPQWNKGGGKTLPGLTRRRKAEVQLFDTPTSVPALPAKC